MIPALSSAAHGIQTGIRRLDRAANDVANASTVGYRGDQRGAPGPVMSTGSPLDLAIQGDGWFRVAQSDGTAIGEVRYTRAGDFHQDGQGFVVASDGRYLLGTPLAPGGQPAGPEGRIRLPATATSVAVGGDGTVSATLADGSTQAVASVSLARFSNPAGLEAVGDGQYRATVNSGAPQVGAPGTGGLGELAGGALEGSNVDLAETTVQQVLARNEVAANVRSMAAADELLKELARVDARA
ncbi:MAG: flagellar hook-basal body complex protein [Thermoleophilia bacterium]